MSYRIDKQTNELVIDGWEKGISPSPYEGISNIRNFNTGYYPGVAYVNYKRLAATISLGTFTFTGAVSIGNTSATLSTNWVYATGVYLVTFSSGEQKNVTLTNTATTATWTGGLANNGTSTFTANPISVNVMTNPVQKATSPLGLNYILDDTGQIWKQNAVNSSTFTLLPGRRSNGSAGLAYWNNYLAVFGAGLIEFCGDGSGDAGIISTNWNINYDTRQVDHIVFTTNFGVAPATLVPTFPYTAQNLPLFQNGDPVTFSTSGTLPNPLLANTTYYLIKNNTWSTDNFALAYRQIDTILHTSAAITSGSTSATLATAWGGTTGSYSIIFSDGEIRTSTLTNGSSAFSWSGGLTNTVTTSIQAALHFTSDGTGTQTMTDVVRVVPFGNCTSVSLFFVGSSPYSQMTFDPNLAGNYGSYVDPTGATVTGMWKGASGIYNLIMANGERIAIALTNGSPLVTLARPLTYIGYGNATVPGYGTSWIIEMINTSLTNYHPYVSKVSGNLLYSGGSDLSQLIYVNSASLLAFSPAIPATENTVGVRAVSLPISSDTITDMVDLKTLLIISGQKDIYTWDYTSGAVSAPSPVGETIYRLVNLLSKVYILAGTKGNIYYSDGYSAQLFFKMPDYIAGVFDPIWSFGDFMVHRSRLFFQALVQTVSGTNVLAGIFSLLCSPAVVGESASGLVMESQNSYGLTPAAGATSAGILIDNESQSTGVDSYYSAWSNGAAIGGIDYNNTTLWQNNEAVIETDIIPIGTILDIKSLGNIQFKLDRPMVSGDSIELSWRANLTDSYTVMGTTNTAVLSDYYKSNVTQAQWIQFRIRVTCAPSNSSRVPLREVRIQTS